MTDRGSVTRIVSSSTAGIPYQGIDDADQFGDKPAAQIVPLFPITYKSTKEEEDELRKAQPPSVQPLAPDPQESNMDDMTKEWVNAKLEAAEERGNARLSDMQARLDIGLANLEGQAKIIGENVRHLADIVSKIHTDEQEMRSEIDHVSKKIDNSEKEVSAEIRETRVNLGNRMDGILHQNKMYHVTVMIAIVATAVAVVALMYQAQSFMLEAFNTGTVVEQDSGAQSQGDSGQ